jgi:hypothetical protein
MVIAVPVHGLPRSAFDVATGFHEVAIRGAERVRDNNTGKIVAPLAPTVVCTAFAAELYMKAIALRRLPKVEGHNLAYLFKEVLQDDERDLIAEQYERVRGANRSKLLKELAAIARAFTEWRYLYEAPRQLDVGALSDFARAAYVAAITLAPEWRPSEHMHERIIANRSTHRAVYLGNGLVVREVEVPACIQPNITAAEDRNFGMTAPTIEFDDETAPINIKVGRCADADYLRPGHSLEFGGIVTGPVIAR